MVPGVTATSVFDRDHAHACTQCLRTQGGGRVGGVRLFLFAAGGGGGEGTCRGGLATEHVLRVFGTVVGMDQVSLIDVAGHASWDAGRDIVRGGVFEDMSLTMGSNRMDFTKLNAYTVNNTGPDANTDGAESAAK